jgi:hypothetical protein
VPAAGAAATPPPVDQDQWLAVLARLALSDGQMRAILDARGELLATRSVRAEERRALAERLLEACAADGPTATPLAAVQTLGYAQGAASSSLAVRGVVSQLRAGLAADYERLRSFASGLLTAVLSPEQGALVLARAPALEGVRACCAHLFLRGWRAVTCRAPACCPVKACA